MTEPITIVGLKEFSRNLRKIDNDLPKVLRVALNQGSDLVIGKARPDIPTLSGRAARSLRKSSTRTAVRVTGGGKRAAYYPWLDFGGRVGKRRSVARPFLKDGRYLYAAYYELRNSGALQEVLTDALLDVVRQAGVEVESSG